MRASYGTTVGTLMILCAMILTLVGQGFAWRNDIGQAGICMLQAIAVAVAGFAFIVLARTGAP